MAFGLPKVEELKGLFNEKFDQLVRELRAIQELLREISAKLPPQ